MDRRYFATGVCIAVFIWWKYRQLPVPLARCENSSNPCVCNKAAFQNFDRPYLQDLIFKDRVPSTHPLLLHYLCKFHLHQPNHMAGYNLERHLEAYLVDNDISLALKAAGVADDKPGFFIECGANDGEYLSNTIGLEIERDWSGLLVEASPSLFDKLEKKNRRTWNADVCLSGKPETIEFLKSKDQSEFRKAIGKIDWDKKYDKPRHEDDSNFKKTDYDSEGTVECFSLLSLLSAINVRTVHFFSLDVEGHEYKVLEAIPFDKIDIKVLIVEHWWVPEGKLAIKALLESHGYRVHSERQYDYIFVKTV